MRILEVSLPFLKNDDEELHLRKGELTEMTKVNDAVFAARQVSNTRKSLQAREENARAERIRKDALSRGQQVCGIPRKDSKPPQAE